MSFFGKRRPSVRQSREGSRGSLEAELRRSESPRSRPVDENASAALVALGAGLARLVRGLRRIHGDGGSGLAALDDAIGRAVLPTDYNEVAERLRAVELAPVAAVEEDGAAFGTEIFHRVVFGARGVATAFGLRAAGADLGELLKVAELDGPEDRALRQLLRILETFSLHASRTREGIDLMKRCVGELIDTLGRLEEGERDHLGELGVIRERLGVAEELHDLEDLRAALLTHAEALVDAAATRSSTVKTAVVSARESRRRAQELEAALTDAEAEARTDPLTGLGNRRAFTEAVARLVPRGADLAVLALDLDHFKRVNDDHGHGAGDEVLRHVADLLRGELRGDDEAFRVGGEELLVLLPDGSWQGARATAERLRSRLAREAVRAGPGLDLRVTMSIGLALWTRGTPFDEALRVADAALYRAKEGGRNRVVG